VRNPGRHLAEDRQPVRLREVVAQPAGPALGRLAFGDLGGKGGVGAVELLGAAGDAAPPPSGRRNASTVTSNQRSPSLLRDTYSRCARLPAPLRTSATAARTLQTSISDMPPTVLHTLK
jgi:hypothetical protein